MRPSFPARNKGIVVSTFHNIPSRKARNVDVAGKFVKKNSDRKDEMFPLGRAYVCIFAGQQSVCKYQCCITTFTVISFHSVQRKNKAIIK
jgi:hypothetical protein